MPSKTQSILIGVAVYTVLSILTSILVPTMGTTGQTVGLALCCLIVIGGPASAVWHYATTHKLTLSAGTGAGLGAAVVAVGGILSYIIGLGLQAANITPTTEEALEMTRQQSLDQGMTAEQIEQVVQMTETMTGPVGIAGTLVVSLLIGAIIGAIAATIFKKGTVEDF